MTIMTKMYQKFYGIWIGKNILVNLWKRSNDIVAIFYEGIKEMLYLLWYKYYIILWHDNKRNYMHEKQNKYFFFFFLFMRFSSWRFRYSDILITYSTFVMHHHFEERRQMVSLFLIYLNYMGMINVDLKSSLWSSI